MSVKTGRCESRKMIHPHAKYRISSPSLGPGYRLSMALKMSARGNSTVICFITLYNVCSVPWEGGGGGCSVLTSTVEGYLEYCGGCSVPWGCNLLLFEYPHGTHDIPPTCIMISPHGTQDIPHGTLDIPQQ